MVVYLVVEAICLDGKVGSALPTVLAMQLVYLVPGLAIVARRLALDARFSNHGVDDFACAADVASGYDRQLTARPMADSERRELHADCARCVGLCCVALEFAASADFAIDKPAGRACPNLQTDFRCAIHAELRQNGFPGCAVYDCFGAGQHVSQVTFAGLDWRERRDLAPRMFTAFGVMRQLHELLWYLSEALALECVQSLRPELRVARIETERLADLDRVALINVDVAAHRERVNAVLRQASELARADVRPRGIDRPAADLLGKDLRRMNLRGANLRGARLIGAKLRGMDLHLADLTGADLRGADLGGANMETTLFVTQSHLESAIGDASTRLPTTRTRPAHWS